MEWQQETGRRKTGSPEIPPPAFHTFPRGLEDTRNSSLVRVISSTAALRMSLTILTTHGLPACSLGCYGEMRIPTPHFDQLASESLVADWYFNLGKVPAADTSLPNLQELTPAPLTASLIQQAANCWLDPQSVEALIAKLPPEDAAWQAWLQVSEEEEEEEEEEELTVWQRGLIACTAHTLSLDAALGETLRQWTASQKTGDVLVILGCTGDVRRGPAGHPDWLTPFSEPAVHVPLLVHQAGQSTHQRLQQLIGPAQADSLLKALACSAGEGVNTWREELQEAPVIFQHGPACSLRTRDWLLIDMREPTAPGQESGIALFRKPEDIWETLDVAAQHGDIVETYLATGRLTSEDSPASEENQS